MMNIEKLKEGKTIKFHYWDIMLKGIIKEIDWERKRCLVLENSFTTELVIYFDDIESIEED